MFGIIKEFFITLLSFSGPLTDVVKIPDHTKCISLNNQPCLPWSTIFDSNPNETFQGLRQNPFMVKLDRCHVRCDIEYVYQTKQKMYLNVFNMLTGINESKTIIKLILYGCKCKFDNRKCN